MKKVLITWLVLFALAAAAIGWVFHYADAPNTLSEPITVIIPKGTRTQQTVAMLTDKGAIAHPWLFTAMAVATGQAPKFKAGEYTIPPQTNPRTIMAMLAEGRVVIHKLTIPEGYNVREISELLIKEDVLTGQMPVLDEGTLLPETYYFTYGDTREAVVGRMREAMKEVLADVWPKRKENLPLATMQEAVILASIVEKETGLDSERGRVAAVYINRLRKGMKLQADPTVAYGIEVMKGPMTRALTYKDLETPTPYNTYTNEGLPRGPIANPGRASLEATLNPPDTDELFFVATGTGGHRFAKTEKEHMANVAAYRAARAQQSQE